MARIRAIEIRRFRGINEFDWLPSPGLNCLIGPGDSGKSSILDAIALCLGSRRSVQFTDTDFYGLDVSTPLTISVTLGELDQALLSLDSYGLYLRSFDATEGTIEDEPEKDGETVLTVVLTVASDLEPRWTLLSQTAAAQGQSRDLSWADRLRLSPARIGAIADYDLGWQRGSVLHRLSEQRADAAAALAKAAREARAAFGNQAGDQVDETLKIVAITARELGIPIGEDVKAMLDAASVSFSGGTITLHDYDGIPLSGLGVGSTRLLIAGLQRKAAAQSTVILIDEVEQGLEPHRIMRFLTHLGAKESVPPLQVFMTTHSPVALRELSGNQLFVLRAGPTHDCRIVGIEDSIQGTIRACPDAFLAPSVLVGEGASEIGLLRGLDLWRTGQGKPSMAALGVALVNGGGAQLYKRANAFRSLGYRTAVLRDDDRRPTPDLEMTFSNGGGKLINWRDGRTVEDELFMSLSDACVNKLLDRAIVFCSSELVNEHIKSASSGTLDLSKCRASTTLPIRTILGKASTLNNGWFKSVTKMQSAGYDIVGPGLASAEEGFRTIVEEIFEWADKLGE